MAFCRFCGKKLEDGELCGCADSVAQMKGDTNTNEVQGAAQTVSSGATDTVINPALSPGLVEADKTDSAVSQSNTLNQSVSLQKENVQEEAGKQSIPGQAAFEQNVQNIPGQTVPLQGGQYASVQAAPEQSAQNIPGQTVPLQGGQYVPGQAAPEQNAQNIPGQTAPLQGGQSMSGQVVPTSYTQGGTQQQNNTGYQTQFNNIPPQSGMNSNSDQFEQFKQSSANYIKKAFDIFKKPVTEGKKFAKSIDYIFIAVIFCVQAFISSLVALVFSAKLDGFFAKPPIAFLLTFFISLILSGGYIISVEAIQIYINKKINLAEAVAMAVVRSIYIIPLLLISLIVSLLNIYLAVFLIVCSIFASVTILGGYAIYEYTVEENKRFVAVLIGTLAFIIIFSLVMRISFDTYFDYVKKVNSLINFF